jgi:glycosyltransferase involved in cell wall biosynthesis
MNPLSPRVQEFVIKPSWLRGKVHNMKNIPLVLQPPKSSRAGLRIAVVTETWPPEINGVALTMQRMVQGLRQRNCRVQLVRPRQKAGEVPVVEDGLEELLLPGFAIPHYEGLRFGFPSRAALKKSWRENRPDLVHVATEGPLGWGALNVALKLDIPVTTDFHTNFHNYTSHYGIGWLSGTIGRYLRNFHNKALYTFVPNEGLRREMEVRRYRNIEVIGRGIDTALFNPQRRNAELRHHWGVADGEPVAIYVGRLAPEKNLDVIAESFKAIRSHHLNARMVWVGDGPARADLEAQNPDHIFVGMKTGEELATHYASADIFLFSSLTETFGNVTLEAMASGLAVVAYRYAAAAEYIRHGDNGLTAPFNDQQEFIDLVAQLGTDMERVGNLGRTARRDTENMSWEAVCDQFEHYLLKAVQQGGQYVRESRFLFVPD